MSQSTIADQGIPESERLELERRRLECEKLRVEIAQASAPWWTHPGYIGSLVPIVLAVVGFGTAFATGYFDTERTSLRTEIDSLAIKRDQLLKDNEGIQKKMDDTYLRLKGALADAEYALGHIASDQWRHDKVKSDAQATLSKLIPEAANVVGDLLNYADFSWEIAKITAEELDQVGERLKDVPASQWAKDMNPTMKDMYIPGRVLMEAPDKRLYDPMDGRYYRPEDFNK